MSDAARETKSERGRDRKGPASDRPDRPAASGSQASQISPSSGTLFVVATPIGNLEDITLRALRVLGEVAVVAAEDTRRSVNLLRHYKIQTPLVSLHEHNEAGRAAQLLHRLRLGESIALISDAGTPGISDPGAVFVQMARDAGVRVDPIPGASAVSAALSASGLSFERYVFAGFPPIRSKDRKLWLEWVRQHPDVPVVFFEAPHRIAATLSEVRSSLVDRPIIAARELTKAHEEWAFFPPASEAEAPDNRKTTPESPHGQLPMPRGEFVVILAPGSPADGEDPAPTDAQVAVLFGQITDIAAAGSRRDAIREVAGRLKLTTKAVYEALERHKKASQT